MLEHLEVLLTEARQTRSVDLGVAAHVVVDARLELPSAAGVLPALGVAVTMPGEHGLGRPVLILARQEVAALDEQHPGPGGPERPRERRPAHPGADDGDVALQRVAVDRADHGRGPG